MQPALPFEQATPDAAHPAVRQAQGVPSASGGESRLANPNLVFTRHLKARRYIIRVADDGTVRVTLPRWGSMRQAREFAARESGWIEKQLRRLEEARQTANGGSDERAAPNDAIDKQSLTGEALRVLRERARRELPPRLLELAAEHGLTVSRISIRNQRWRWGSCSRSGHICLNWRLVTMPQSVRDYVLIHELMHLKRMDHSPKFWKLVAAACPDYQNSRRWLRQVSRA
jgi:predicted metal-dependent hydrolase